MCWCEYTEVPQQSHFILLLVCVIMRSWHLTKLQYELCIDPNLLLLKSDLLLKVGHTGINMCLEIGCFSTTEIK